MIQGKKSGGGLRAFERLPRQVTLAECGGNRALRKMQIVKNVRVTDFFALPTWSIWKLRMSGIWLGTPGLPMPLG